MGLLKGEMVIDDSTDNDLLFPVGFGRGGEPRDYDESPEEMFSPVSELQLIPQSEWSARIKEKAAQQAQLSDVRNRADGGKPFVNLNQGPDGYCWAYSTGHAGMLVRAINNQPYVRLNPHGVAAIIKRGANEGGWCGLSAKFGEEVGYPSEATWPPLSRDYKKYDTPAMRADANKHRLVEKWADLTRQIYDQRFTFEQLATCLLLGIPCPCDFYWWGHSVCAMDLVEVEPGDFGIRIINSWLNWGANGTAVIRGEKKYPNSCLALLAVSGSSN